MRIIGFDKRDMVVFMLTQSFIISLTGIGIAMVAYLLVSHFLNGLFTFSDNINVYCKLEMYHIIAILCASVLFSINCSAFAIIKMGFIDISEAVKHV